VNNINFRHNGKNKKSCIWLSKKKKKSTRNKICNRIAKYPNNNIYDNNNGSNNGVDGTNNEKKKISSYCPGVCKKECKPCKDKERKIGYEGKRRTCKWLGRKDKCNMMKPNGKYIYEKCKMTCGKCNNISPTTTTTTIGITTISSSTEEKDPSTTISSIIESSPNTT